jgi:hypothetical protein
VSHIGNHVKTKIVAVVYIVRIFGNVFSNSGRVVISDNAEDFTLRNFGFRPTGAKGALDFGKKMISLGGWEKDRDYIVLRRVQTYDFATM